MASCRRPRQGRSDIASANICTVNGLPDRPCSGPAPTPGSSHFGTVRSAQMLRITGGRAAGGETLSRRGSPVLSSDKAAGGTNTHKTDNSNSQVAPPPTTLNRPNARSYFTYSSNFLFTYDIFSFEVVSLHYNFWFLWTGYHCFECGSDEARRPPQDGLFPDS